jgi:uncharacterized membrane protein YfcA
MRAITRLRTWESLSQTAAQYSTTASTQLFNVRATQAAAAFALLSSCFSAFSLLFYTGHLGSVAVANGVVCTGAWYYFSPFWREQKNVPGATMWNEALGASAALRGGLFGIAVGWMVVFLLGEVGI